MSGKAFFSVHLAFAVCLSAYVCWAAAPGKHNPSIVYDSYNNRHMVAYLDGTANKIRCATVNSAGVVNSSPFDISSSTGNVSNPAIVYDPPNKRFLVAWSDMRTGVATIYAQFVTDTGALSGPNFPVSSGSYAADHPSLAMDTGTGNFLAAWDETWGWVKYIYGAILNTSGVITSPGGSFLISKPTAHFFGGDYGPSAAFFNAAGSFITVWTDTYSGAKAVMGSYVSESGTVATATQGFTISQTGFTNSENPRVAYDAYTGAPFVVWQRWQNSIANVVGMYVNSSGSRYSFSDYVISAGLSNRTNPFVGINIANGISLTAWSDDRADAGDVYGQLMNPSGTQNGSELLLNNDINWQGNTSVSFNSQCSDWLTAYETLAGGTADLGFSLTGPACSGPLSAPVLLSPSSGASALGATVPLSWAPVAGAVSYNLYISTSPSFTGTSPVTIVARAGGSRRLYALLAWSGVLLGAAFGPLCKKRLLALLLFSIAVVAIIVSCGGPDYSGTTGTSNSNQNSTPGSTSNSNPNNTPANNGSINNSNAISYQVSGLSPSSTYYWRVGAVDARGVETLSETRSFTTK